MQRLFILHNIFCVHNIYFNKSYSKEILISMVAFFMHCNKQNNTEKNFYCAFTFKIKKHVKMGYSKSGFLIFPWYPKKTS